MSDNTVILEVNDLHKSYGDHEVLKGISTTIKRRRSGTDRSIRLRKINFPAFSKSA